MGRNKNNFSAVKRGMNRNTAPYLLEGMEYLFALNTNIQDGETTVINLTNEESNILANKFKEGFKVIGKKNDIITKGTYFFLVNPETEESEFGIIKGNQIEQAQILDDLDRPLEEVDQEPYEEFTTLIDKGLSLDITHPVNKIVIKNEQSGTVISFTDNLNPPRQFVLENLEDYLIEGKEVDPDKIAIFKKATLPKINVQPLVTGGRLKRGTYEFLVAYTNSQGEEISEYTSITNPIPIFDSNNVILEQSELADRTNYAIKLELTNLDSTKDYYKVVVIQNTSIDGGVEFFVEGVHPTSDTTVIYATDENKERTYLSIINRTFPYVQRWKGITESNGHLIGYGETQHEEINLQPVVNLMGSFLKWQTSVAKETLYESADDVSTSKGYMRDETYPFSFRFKLDSGYTTALFPTIGRPALPYTFIDGNTYLETNNVPNTDDVKSIRATRPEYVESNRTKLWQFYNTATLEGNREVDVDYNTVTEPVTKNSLIEEVGVIPEPRDYIRIKLFREDPFTTLENYLEDHNDRWQNEDHPLNYIYEYFNPENYPQHSIPQFDDCSTPEHLEDRDMIVVNDIENEQVKLIRRNVDGYIGVALDDNQTLYKVNASGDRAERKENFKDAENNEENESSLLLWVITDQYYFQKVKPPTNNERKYAVPIEKLHIDVNATRNTTLVGYYNDGEAAATLDSLLTNYKSTPKGVQETDTHTSAGSRRISGQFYRNVGKNATWFSDSFQQDEHIKILEVTRYVREDKFFEAFSAAKILRVTMFNDCTDESGDCNETEPIITFFVDVQKGQVVELSKAELQGKEHIEEAPSPGTGGVPPDRGRSNKDTIRHGERETIRDRAGQAGTRTTRRVVAAPTTANLPTSTIETVNPDTSRPIREDRSETLKGNKFLIAIDTPIGEDSGAYFATGFRGKYAVHTRPIEYGTADVMFDRITLDKRESYRATCNFNIPNVNEYEVLPYQYGKFAYTESLEKYPDNEELYDSSKLKVDLNKIPESIKEEFKDYYISHNPDGSYLMNGNADFRRKPIRHFKFPDNDVSSFMTSTNQASFSDSMIFPIGVHIDDEVVNSFLDIAVDNELLTQKQRDSIIAYEVFRGDRTLEKSVEAKGLIYDNYQIEENNEKVYFPNFPFNTLGENILAYQDAHNSTFIQHPYNSDSNNSFSFISPDNQFRKLTTPTELQVEGYQFGNSKSYFSDVEDHPKWVILGDKGYRLATTLAIAETTAEVAIQIAEATIETSKNMWFMAGVSSGGNPIGAGVGGVATAVIAGFQILAESVFKVARYRHQWLTTFRDLGQPENFASYYTGIGHYNSLLSLASQGNKLRGISTIKELGSGRYSFRHRDDGKKIVVNNKDREKSTYIYTGEEYRLEYPFDYYMYDNQKENPTATSRTIASAENACYEGQSPEVIGNVASPYISLKNYIPSQYGTINSIKWLPTSHISYFENKEETIFGGDVFISRMTMKRKMPLFLRDAMKVPSLTPFNYDFYSNVGNTRFYVDYEVSGEVNLENTLFPNFQSQYEMDCQTNKNAFYVKPPSKFYLYYYGIVDFLVESEINSNFRHGRKELKDNFYPNVGDIVEWTQETNVSIKESNSFFYNFAYSLPVTTVNHRTLPFTYKKEVYNNLIHSPNGVRWSLPDNSEKDLTEPWLTFRPYDFHNFPSSYGDLIDLKGIESNRVLARFTDQTAIYNVVDFQVGGITSESGDGHMFARPPRTFTETDLGYLGSQTTQVVSTEYGHFFPDTERGQIFRIDPAGEGLEEISRYSNQAHNGMDKWFKKHLPFKVLNSIVNNYEDIDTDNAFNGIGITMGWDSRYKRVFITKKDYIPLQEMNYENGSFFGAKDELELITDYEADGYTYLGKEGYYYKFNKPTVNIDSNATLFAIINVNDYTRAEAQEIKEEILDWADLLPNYNGEVVIISTFTNRWLSIPNDLEQGNFNEMYNQGSWNNFSTYTGQRLGSTGVVVNFTNTSGYTNNAWLDIRPDVVNLLRNSDKNVNSGTYQMVTYTLGKTIPQGTQVTLSLRGNLGPNNTHLGIFNSDGSTYLTELYPSDRGSDGIIRKTFNWNIGRSSNNNLVVFQMPVGADHGSTIEWAMLIEDNVITDSETKVNPTQRQSIKVYNIGRKIPNGTQVTIQLKGTLGRDYFSLYANNGNTYVNELWPANETNGIFTKTFTWNGGDSSNLTLYQHGTEGNSSIEYLRINAPVETGWVASPLDTNKATNEFISDYKKFMATFNRMDSLRNIIVSKNDIIKPHIEEILENEGEYKDRAVPGTSPQMFIEPLNIYGVSHTTNFTMNTEQALNEAMGDDFIDGTILVKGDVIEVVNTDFFKDVSWTVAYQVETGSWLSYYSFEPNYYIAHNNYFQTGINNQIGKEGIWSHVMSNKSYGVFYGEKFPWMVEYPIKNEYVAKRLQNLTFSTEARKNLNEHDFAYDRNQTFNKVTVYNSHDNSGELNLIPQKTLSQVSKYPITRGKSQDVLITNQDFNWTFNNIYNRTLNQDGTQTAWVWDENQIHKTINHELVHFGGKKILSYLRGNYFIVRLTYDKSTEHNMIFRWATNQEEIY